MLGEGPWGEKARGDERAEKFAARGRVCVVVIVVVRVGVSWIDVAGMPVRRMVELVRHVHLCETPFSGKLSRVRRACNGESRFRCLESWNSLS